MTRYKTAHHLLAILLLLILVIGLPPATSSAMQVFVKLQVEGGSQQSTLEVEPTDRIEDVREKIFEKTGIPAEQQVLTFNGEELEDGKTLQDYVIRKDSTLQLMRREQGPDAAEFATAEQLRGFNTDDTDGSNSAAKVYLGENGQQWWIAGSQSEESLVLFSASSLGVAVFHNDLNDQVFNEQAVYASHYGASQIRTKLTELAQSLFNVYESALLMPSTIYTEDAKNGTVYALSDELYLGYATYTYDTKTYFYVGENSEDSLESGLRVDSRYLGEDSFWLRSPYSDYGSIVSIFWPGRGVDYYRVAIALSVYPAVKIDLSKILFGSAAPAAAGDGALTMADTDGDGAFTLRYASNSLGTAEVSYDKTSVNFSGVPEGTYLVVQDSTGTRAKAVGGAGSVTAAEMTVTSFENCKVWLEKTEDRIASATLATQGSPPPATYTLAFDTDGGSSITSVNAVEGSVIDLSKYTPEKDGFVFTGWYTNRNLTGKVASITLDGHKTVYAGWTVAATETPDITDLPETGDNHHMLLWVVLLLLSGGALGAAALRKKKQSN